MSSPPGWLKELADAAALLMMPADVMPPIGCHYCSVGSTWEISLFASSTQVVGGGRDGDVRRSRFCLDVEGIRKLFDEVLAYAEESVFDPSLEQRRQRIRWWSALALLRSMASSPAAAAMTLRTRAVGANTPEEADAAGRRAVLDLAEDDSAEGSDVAPAGDPEEVEGPTPTEAGRRLMESR